MDVVVETLAIRKEVDVHVESRLFVFHTAP